MAKPQRQAGALTADVLAVIRLTARNPVPAAVAWRPPRRPPSTPGSTWPWWPSCPTGGLRRSEPAALTWGDVQRWDDGSGRITVARSKTDTEAQGAVVAIIPAAMRALDAVRPAGAAGDEEVFGLSES